MKVVQVKCPQCGAPVVMKQKDLLLYCSSCGTIHTRDNGIVKVEYEVAEFRNDAQGEKMYLPFWRLYSLFNIRSSNVQGGTLRRLLNGGGGNGGYLNIFIPAMEMDPASFRHWAVAFTTNPPVYTVRANFNGVPTIPAEMSRDEAIEMADFVVVTLEAERPGILQSLDYSLTVQAVKVVYIPFIRTQAGMVPGI